MNVVPLLGVLFFLTPLAADAQLIRSEHYTAERRKATSSMYAVRRDITREDQGFVINDFNKKGRQLFSGHYSSIDPEVEHGTFTFYDKLGRLDAEGVYTSGEMSGIWTFYNDDSSVRKKINYDFGAVKCNPSDTSEATDTLGIVDSTSAQIVPVFMDGKVNAFYRFLYDQLEYPPLPKMLFKTGRVHGIFIIDTGGNVCGVSTDGSANKDLEKETRRVISMSPKWQPGRLGDKPVSVKFSCPILFKFE